MADTRTAPNIGKRTMVPLREQAQNHAYPVA